LDGSSYTTVEYLYTTCDLDSEPGEGVGGGGETPIEDPQPPEKPNDLEVTVDQELSKTDYLNDEDDAHVPIPGGDIEVDGDGNPLPPQPYYSQLNYTYHVSITYKLMTREVIGAYTHPMTVEPASEQYDHPQWGPVLRNVTPFNSLHSCSYSGATVNAWWTGLVNIRYTYIALGSSRTTQRNADARGSFTVQ